MAASGSRGVGAYARGGWRVRLPFFYGWVVVASIFLVLVISYGACYSFSVFFVALLEEFGWSRAAAAGALSIQIMVTGFTGVISGGLVDRFGPGRVMSAGGIFLAVAMVGASRLTQLWEFYLYFGVVGGVAVSLAGWVPCVAVVSRWFSRRRGTAIGITSAGIAVGVVVMVPLCQYLILSLGWRPTFLVVAALALLVIVPQAAYLQVGRPSELSLRPDGAAEGEKPASSKAPAVELVVVDQKWASRTWTVSDALRTARFWLLVGTLTVGVVTNQMLWAHQAAYMVDAGMEKMAAASVVGIAGVASLVFKILWGVVADRLGRELTLTLGIGSMLAAILALTLTGIVPSLALAALFAVCFGAGSAVMPTVPPAAAGDIFTGRHFGAIFGLITIGTGLGGSFGPWFAGFIFDATGSYLVAFAVAAACSLASAACIWLAAPRKVRRVVRRRP